jgi:aminoglycoside phosphotransferase (APT) family kinase protein
VAEQAVDQERAERLLAELLPGYGPVTGVSRFAEGTVTGAYRIGVGDGRAVVLKVYGPGESWSAAKEAGALGFLTEHGIGISPRLLAFSRAAAALDGRACVLSALRPGRTLSAIHDELTADQRSDVYRQLGTVLARLHAVPAAGYGYVYGGIRDPLPDNSAHMARMCARYLDRFRADAADPSLPTAVETHLAAHAGEFAACERPSYCHGDVHEPNLLVRPAPDGTCALTGLLDPLNLHAGDPLMDFVRLDAFSMNGDPAKLAALLTGYGAPATPPGTWPAPWRPRLALYRVVLALELHNWFAMSAQPHLLPPLEADLRRMTTPE